MDFIAIMIICFILGMCFQFYVGRTVAKLFKDKRKPKNLDGLRGKRGK